MDPSLSFHKHCNYVTDRIDKRNNMLNALAGSFWGHDKETLLLTYNAFGKYISSYAAPVRSTNASASRFKKIQTAQNAVLRTATDAHKMARIEHLHQECLTLKVKDHTDMLSGYSAPRKQQGTEAAPTPNSGRGADTEPKATMHSLTATIRPLPSTVGLQA